MTTALMGENNTITSSTTMAQFPPTTGPFKTFQIVNNHTLNARHLQICHDDQTLLWAETERKFLSSPQVRLHAGNENGPVVASVKLQTTSRDFLVAIGGGQPTDRVDCGGFTSKQYSFAHAGRQFCWRRTHDSALGASSIGSQDFKLLDAANERQVLAVYVNKNWGMRAGVGRLEWMVDLGEQLEILSIAVLLGVQMKVRRNQAVSAGGAAGSF